MSISTNTNSISAILLASGATRETFTTVFPPLFEKHYGRSFDVHDTHDLMLSECAFSEAFGWIGDDGVVYR